MRRKLILCVLVFVGLCGCQQAAPSSPLAREAENAPTMSVTATEAGVLPDLPGGLKLEEHRLVAAPEPDPLTFKPAQGSLAEILAAHAELRGRLHPPYLDGDGIFIEGQYRRTIVLRDTPFSAVEISRDPTQTTTTVLWGTREVQVLEGDEVIYTIDAGHTSPLNSFQSLWSYDGRWVLEIAHVIESRVPDSYTVSSDVKGMIVDNGVLLNDKHGYDEAFGFQLIAGRPFYFFKRGGSIGIFYEGQEVDLGYTGIPHYGCCSATMLNPQKSETMVAFFAQRDEVWYYVELGGF